MPGLVVVLARTKSVASPIVDIYLTVYLEGKRLDIHRGSSRYHKGVVVEDRRVLVDIAHRVTRKLVLECYSTYRGLRSTNSKALKTAHKDGASTQRQRGAREGRHRGKELRGGDISEGSKAYSGGLDRLRNRLPIDARDDQLGCRDNS